jgi:hypothetical protein
MERKRAVLCIHKSNNRIKKGEKEILRITYQIKLRIDIN